MSARDYDDLVSLVRTHLEPQHCYATRLNFTADAWLVEAVIAGVGESVFVAVDRRTGLMRTVSRRDFELGVVTCCEELAHWLVAGKVETDADGRWQVVGCCGSCYVLAIDHCPGCGQPLGRPSSSGTEVSDE